MNHCQAYVPYPTPENVQLVIDTLRENDVRCDEETATVLWILIAKDYGRMNESALRSKKMMRIYLTHLYGTIWTKVNPPRVEVVGEGTQDSPLLSEKILQYFREEEGYICEEESAQRLAAIVTDFYVGSFIAEMLTDRETLRSVMSLCKEENFWKLCYS